ncbi:MAG: YiiX/YebB-like N1pC/P60 family cysteine hydrolase [Bacteroidales bacterium]|nr:YiiX/YebB-like N1pC/P60 family cysteine hydrolase [Bacteroidales bacterium]
MRTFSIISLISFLTFYYINFLGQNYNLSKWDLIFLEAGNDSFSLAIKSVTPSYKGISFNHVGVIIEQSDSLFVLEATFNGVILTKLTDFLKKISNDSIFVGKINTAFSEPKENDIKKLIGKEYDYFFDIYNDFYYCSEIVYTLYKTPEGKPLFELTPMTFVDTISKQIIPFWKNYFEKLNIDIPEGEPGISPGSIANSSNLIIYKLNDLKY